MAAVTGVLVATVTEAPAVTGVLAATVTEAPAAVIGETIVAVAVGIFDAVAGGLLVVVVAAAVIGGTVTAAVTAVAGGSLVVVVEKDPVSAEAPVVIGGEYVTSVPGAEMPAASAGVLPLPPVVS